MHSFRFFTITIAVSANLILGLSSLSAKADISVDSAQDAALFYKHFQLPPASFAGSSHAGSDARSNVAFEAASGSELIQLSQLCRRNPEAPECREDGIGGRTSIKSPLPRMLIQPRRTFGMNETSRMDRLYKRLEEYVAKKQGRRAATRLAELTKSDDNSQIAAVLTGSFTLGTEAAKVAAKVIRAKGEQIRRDENASQEHRSSHAKASGSIS